MDSSQPEQKAAGILARHMVGRTTTMLSGQLQGECDHGLEYSVAAGDEALVTFYDDHNDLVGMKANGSEFAISLQSFEASFCSSSH